MDSPTLEHRVSVFNRSPCTIGGSNLAERITSFGRVTFMDEPITVRVPFTNVIKVPTSISNLKVEY
jgi:hypothetical protein